MSDLLKQFIPVFSDLWSDKISKTPSQGAKTFDFNM